MKVSSANIPQADRLQNVISLIREIDGGAHTDEELIANISSLNTSRQGRYYRNAAQILGFVNNHRNHAELTAAGRDLLHNPSLTNPQFMAAVLRIDIIQQLLPLLETKPAGITRQHLMEYTTEVSAPVGPTVIPRRVNTIISWLRDIGVIEERNGLIFLNRSFTTHMPVLEVPDVEQPLFPITADLKEYKAVEERVAKAQEAIAYYKDAAKLERSNLAHQRLVNLVASRISAAGGVAKTNALIDLATAVDEDFIFEMKSLGDTNIRSQVRKGLSQLYEYRYLQNKSDAKLVLVLEKPLPRKEQWMIDYLEIDRNINVIWDGDGLLYGTERARKNLNFLKVV